MSRLLRSLCVLGCVACGLLSSGCITTGPLDWVQNGFKVGPNYCRPPAPVADEWIEAKDPNVQRRHVEDWWNVFQDPVLNSLIDTAYNQNLNLRVLGTRVLQARAQLKRSKRKANIAASVSAITRLIILRPSPGWSRPEHHRLRWWATSIPIG
jgi:hypothetical protein